MNRWTVVDKGKWDGRKDNDNFFTDSRIWTRYLRSGRMVSSVTGSLGRGTEDVVIKQRRDDLTRMITCSQFLTLPRLQSGMNVRCSIGRCQSTNDPFRYSENPVTVSWINDCRCSHRSPSRKITRPMDSGLRVSHYVFPGPPWMCVSLDVTLSPWDLNPLDLINNWTSHLYCRKTRPLSPGETEVSTSDMFIGTFP